MTHVKKVAAKKKVVKTGNVKSPEQICEESFKNTRKEIEEMVAYVKSHVGLN